MQTPTAQAPPNCPVCGKETARGTIYCRTHAHADENAKQAFSAWAKAYGNLSIDEFLKRTVKLQGTGQRAKDILEYFQRKGPRWK